MTYSAAIPMTPTLVSFLALHVFYEGEREGTPLFGLAAILHRSGFCFHLFKWYASEPVLTGLRDPPICSCLKREQHACLTQGSNKVVSEYESQKLGVQIWPLSFWLLWTPPKKEPKKKPCRSWFWCDRERKWWKDTDDSRNLVREVYFYVYIKNIMFKITKG